MVTREDIIAIANQHITDKHEVLGIEQREDGQLVTVQFYGPLDVMQFAEFGMAVGAKYPSAKALGPNVFEDYKIRFLI